MKAKARNTRLVNVRRRRREQNPFAGYRRTRGWGTILLYMRWRSDIEVDREGQRLRAGEATSNPQHPPTTTQSQ